MKVLELFSGMSGAQIALQKLGITPDVVFASEINKQAIKVSVANFPDTIHLGDVQNVKGADLGHIDICIAGSPCQGFSFAGKGLNFDDERSKLFFEFVRIKNELQAINPDLIFLLENVRMKKEHELVISHYLGVFPIQINSSLVSAQNRVRNYWTNILAEPFNLFGYLRSTIPQPKDKKIFLKDILQPSEEIDAKYYLTGATLKRIMENQPRINPDKSYAVKINNNTSGLGGKRDTTLVKIDVNGKPKANQLKASCFTAGGHSAGNHSDMDLIVESSSDDYLKDLPDSKWECECGLEHLHGKTHDEDIEFSNNYWSNQPKILQRAQNGKTPSMTLSDWKENDYLITHNLQPRGGKGSGGKGHLYKTDQKNYCVDTGNNQAIEIRKVKQLNPSKESGGNQPYQQNRIYDVDGIAPTLSAGISGGLSGSGGIVVAIPSHAISNIRRLTPIECCRLQTVSDDLFYDADGKQIVSDSAIYKMLGNGFTIDVIAYILSFAFGQSSGTDEKGANELGKFQIIKRGATYELNIKFQRIVSGGGC